MTDSERLPGGTSITNLLRADGLIARVITDRDDPEVLTPTRTTDSRTALARGLAEYLGQQRLVWDGGREVAFASVHTTWAQPEDPSTSPALTVTTAGDGQYDTANLTPTLVEVVPGRAYLRQTAELNQEFLVLAWAQDPSMRLALSALLEDAFEPTEFMTGLRLELPYYFGARATYLATALNYADQAEGTAKRWRTVGFVVTGCVPRYRPVGTPPSLHTELELGVF